GLLCGSAAWAQCKDPGSTMLWQVEGGNGASVSLLGSIHVGKPDFYPLPAVVDQRFRGANTLVFEVDPASAQSPEAVVSMQARGMLAGDKTLEQIIDAQTMTSLKDVMQKQNMPMMVVERMKPWMISMVLTALQVQALGYDPQYGVESYLVSHKPASTAIAELESLDSQLALLDSFDQATLLRYSLQDYSDTSNQMEAMVSAWRCGDHRRLADILFEARQQLHNQPPAQAAALEKLMRQLFDERNVHMADKIEGYLKTGKGSYLVTVGAGHLLGDGSVIALLQQRGFKVTPVRSK
ncbi:MAG TPA: TraB/GumN family protein, partial [Candidatus Acidoferrum sp.]|nr:TraB/GumN family protein [Candidatus Acidoferrum sp.]